MARHGAEKISFYQFLSVASFLVKLFITGGQGEIPMEGLVRELFLFLPFSRKCEQEADYIGLLLMARACYDPREAIGMWERMGRKEKGVSVPAFLSTHPSHQNRIEKISEWLPEAERIYYEEGHCAGLARKMQRSARM